LKTAPDFPWAYDGFMAPTKGGTWRRRPNTLAQSGLPAIEDIGAPGLKLILHSEPDFASVTVVCGVADAVAAVEIKAFGAIDDKAVVFGLTPAPFALSVSVKTPMSGWGGGGRVIKEATRP